MNHVKLDNENKRLNDQLEVSNEKNIDADDEIDDLKGKIIELTKVKIELEETVFKKNLSIEELTIQNKDLKDDLERAKQIHEQVII